MRILILSLLAFACAACAMSGQTGYPPTTVKLVAVKVSEHSYFVQGMQGVASKENQGLTANAGFVVTDNGVVVIDALGTPSLGAKFIQLIQSVTNKPIKRVIVTHYHADHFYGLQAFKEIGAEIWAQREGKIYLASSEATERLAQRRRDLNPWVNETTRLVPADKWLDNETEFEMGGVKFAITPMGPAHSPEDIVIAVTNDKVLFSGDILFAGRLPFVGEADSKQWLNAIEKLLLLEPKVMITGHGKTSADAKKDLSLTRDYLRYLRKVMGKAVEDFTPFDEAYAMADWRAFNQLPAFEAANRINAYGTYLLMEKEALAQQK